MKNTQSDFMKANFDFSAELIITPFKRGVKLLVPTKNDKEPVIGTSLNDAMFFPCNLFLLNQASECVLANDQMAVSLDLNSPRKIVGKTILDFCPNQLGREVMLNDAKVLDSESPLFVDEVAVMEEKIKKHFLSVKIPLYNNDNDISGIFGFSMVLKNQPLAETLNLLSKIGLLNLFNLTERRFLLKSGTIIDGVNFTDRQRQIINLVVRGFSAAKIASEIELSKRTVEHYIDTIKIKLHVNSKTQLIDKIVQFIHL